MIIFTKAHGQEVEQIADINIISEGLKMFGYFQIQVFHILQVSSPLSKTFHLVIKLLDLLDQNICEDFCSDYQPILPDPCSLKISHIRNVQTYCYIGQGYSIAVLTATNDFKMHESGHYSQPYLIICNVVVRRTIVSHFLAFVRTVPPYQLYHAATISMLLRLVLTTYFCACNITLTLTDNQNRITCDSCQDIVGIDSLCMRDMMDTYYYYYTRCVCGNYTLCSVKWV